MKSSSILGSGTAKVEEGKMASSPTLGTGTEKGQDVDYIIVMGQTGAGKSSFINCATESKEMGVNHGIKSETIQVKELFCEIDGQKCCLVDSPGFGDTYRSDADVLLSISSWMEMTYRKGIKINGIIHLRGINRNRMTGSELINLRVFREICGLENMPSVVFASTFWDTIKDDKLLATKEEQLEDLLTNPKYLKADIDAGARIARHDNTTKGAREIVKMLLRRSPITFAIQKEIVDEGKALDQTAAGLVINEAVHLQKANIEKEYAANVEALKTVQNEELRKLMEKENQRLKAQTREKIREFETLKHQFNREDEEILQKIAEVKADAEGEQPVMGWKLFIGRVLGLALIMGLVMVPSWLVGLDLTKTSPGPVDRNIDHMMSNDAPVVAGYQYQEERARGVAWDDTPRAQVARSSVSIGKVAMSEAEENLASRKLKSTALSKAGLYKVALREASAKADATLEAKARTGSSWSRLVESGVVSLVLCVALGVFLWTRVVRR